MRRALAVAILVLAPATSGCGADSTPPPLQITTTVLAGAATTTQPPDISSVAVDGVRLESPGALAAVDPEVETLRSAAQADRSSTLLVVSNFVPDLGEYSGDLARAMLSDAASRRAVVADVASAAGRFDGVQIELSGLAAPDSAALVDFMAELRKAVPDDAVVTLGVVASTDFGGYRERGYDIEALKPSVDRFVLQTFEPGGTNLLPEPLGASAGIGAEVDYLASQIDSDHIDLGITPTVGLTLAEATAIARTAALHGVVVASGGFPTP